MDMTVEAMEHIAENEAQSIVVVQEHLDSLDNGEALVSTLQAKLGKVEIINLEQHKANRDNYRGSLDTHMIDDFAAYTKDFAADGTHCFINAEAMSCKAVLDNGTQAAPGHRRHSAKLSLRKSNLYKALLAVVDRKLSQREAAEFLEDYTAEIEALDADNKSMLGGVAAQTIRNMTIDTAREVNSRVGDFENQASAMEKIEARNKDKIVVRFRYQCEPYIGLGMREFEVRVTLITQAEAPKIVFRIIRHEEHEDSMAEEFKGIMLEKLGEISTTIGTFTDK